MCLSDIDSRSLDLPLLVADSMISRRSSRSSSESRMYFSSSSSRRITCEASSVPDAALSLEAFSSLVLSSMETSPDETAMAWALTSSSTPEYSCRDRFPMNSDISLYSPASISVRADSSSTSRSTMWYSLPSWV